MAEYEYEVTITWENEKSIKMTTIWKGGTEELIIQCNENAHLPENWSNIASIMKRTFDTKIDIIGEEMIA